MLTYAQVLVNSVFCGSLMADNMRFVNWDGHARGTHGGIVRYNLLVSIRQHTSAYVSIRTDMREEITEASSGITY